MTQLWRLPILWLIWWKSYRVHYESVGNVLQIDDVHYQLQIFNSLKLPRFCQHIICLEVEKLVLLRILNLPGQWNWPTKTMFIQTTHPIPMILIWCVFLVDSVILPSQKLILFKIQGEAISIITCVSPGET